MKTRLIVIIILCTLLFLGTAVSTYIYFTSKQNPDSASESNTTERQGNEEGDSAGSDDSTEPSQDDDATEDEQEYYGSSLLGTCDCGCDCVTDGCNGEICRSKDDESVGTICSIPDKPLPADLGYSCTCVQNKCQWTK